MNRDGGGNSKGLVCGCPMFMLTLWKWLCEHRGRLGARCVFGGAVGKFGKINKSVNSEIQHAFLGVCTNVRCEALRKSFLVLEHQ